MQGPAEGDGDLHPDAGEVLLLLLLIRTALLVVAVLTLDGTVVFVVPVPRFIILLPHLVNQVMDDFPNPVQQV